MAKPKKNLLSGIDLEDIDIAATIEYVGKTLQKDAPAIQKGLRDVGKDVGKAVKMLYDTFAGDEKSDTE